MTGLLKASRPNNGLILPYWMTLWSGLCTALALTAGTVLQLQISQDFATVVASVMIVALASFVAGRGIGAILARRRVTVHRLIVLLTATGLVSFVPGLCGPALMQWGRETGHGDSVLLAGLALLGSSLLFFGAVSRYALPLLALSRGREGDIRQHLTTCLLAGGAIGAGLGGYGLLPHMKPNQVFMLISAATVLFSAAAALRYPPGVRR